MEIPVPLICGDKIDVNRTSFEANFDYADAIPVNMIGVAREVLGAPGTLLSHDGLKSYVTGFGADRGALYNERWKRTFRVSGTHFIEMKSDGTIVDIGTITGVDKCSIAYSFQSIMIVTNGNAWRYDGATLTQMTDPDLGHPIDVTWIDGYYFFTDGEYLFHTDIGDETSIDPLKFATSELSPDPTKAVNRTQDDLIVVFNRYTIEYFINSAQPFFAFSRLNQKALNCGIIGTHSWCEMDGNIFILGGRKEENPSIHIIGAGQAQSISTRYVDKLLSGYTEDQLASSVLEARISNRDKLLYVYLPTQVLVYNHTIAKLYGINVAWSALKTGVSSKWRACNGIYDPLINKWVYGDISTSNICYLDQTSAAQYGASAEVEFYTPLIPIESSSVDEVELNIVSGMQSASVFLFISSTRDGAVYSTEWSDEAGIPFDYSLRCIFRRLGYVKKNIGFKFRSLTTEKISVNQAVVRYGQ